MYKEPAYQLSLNGKPYRLSRPEVMGILNVTPDSFFAGSRMQSEKEIACRACRIIEEGGAMIDVGACSTRPGSTPVSEEEEMKRLRFALGIINKEQPAAIVSVDTFRPAAAKMCVEEYGAVIVNDVSEGSVEMFKTMGLLGVAYVLMSVQPTIGETKEAFKVKIKMLSDCGCGNIILDPGYGFGKNLEQNYAMLRRQEELLDFGYPLLVGMSRKRMVWQLLGTGPEGALNGTTVLNAMAVIRGASILRVHDVKQAVETIKIAERCF